MKFENTLVAGFEPALRGMRNAMESWNKSDSTYVNGDFVIGPNDLGLAQRLIRNGSEHRKFLRQIMVWVNITAPLYWWKEFDTYKVGTTANSTSTMHKLASTPITIDCFETDDLTGDLPVGDKDMTEVFERYIENLEEIRKQYFSTKDKRYWKELIRLLPESWLQTRTVSMNYENLLSIAHQRRNHKLNEWSGKDKPEAQNFIAWMGTLPYAEEFLFIDNDEQEK